MQQIINKLPDVNSFVYYRYTDQEGKEVWAHGKVLRHCPHFLPPTVWVRSIKGKPDSRYLRITELGTTWWTTPVTCWADVYKIWEGVMRTN